MGNALHDAIRARDELANRELAGLWDDVDQVWDVGTAPDGRRIAVIPLMYTAAVIIGHPRQPWYDDRWCYTTAAAALAAAQAWDGVGEPTGWHRHPSSGRRRRDGEPSTEYMAP